MNFVKRIPHSLSNFILPANQPISVLGATLSYNCPTGEYYLGKTLQLDSGDLCCRFHQGVRIVKIEDRKILIPNILVDRIKTAEDPYELLRNNFNVYCYDTISKEDAFKIKDSI